MANMSTIYPLEERVNGIRKLLVIPDHVIPLALIPIGYPAEEKPGENRYDDLDSPQVVLNGNIPKKVR